ncbi:MAG: sugar ABC transporter permease [Geminicoccaceae bacterium]
MPLAAGPRYDRRRLVAWAFALPLLVGLIAFAVYPTVYLLFLSFSQSTLGAPFKAWVGWKNYATSLTDTKFTDSLWRSVGLALLTTGLAVGLGLAVALLLDAAVRARALLRTLILLPLLTPPVTVGIVWQLMLMPKGGWVNSFLMDLGAIAEPVSFLGSPVWAFPFLCLADVWQWTPFVALMTYAALQTLPDEVFDAARIDGAGAGAIFRHITLPMLAPALAAVALLKLVIGFKVFDLIFVLTAGGPGQATTVASFNIYRVAIQQFDIGLAATQTLLFGVVVGLATLPFTLAHDRLERRLS